jgi:hypothetical protein
MFADDTNLACEGVSSEQIEQKLNNDLNNVQTWLTCNKLTLNKEKTEYMIIGSRLKLNNLSRNPNIVIGNHSVERVQDKKVLGVKIDKELKWKDHIDAQCKKISKNVALLRRAKNFTTEQTLLTMYNALILPHLTYCSNVWHDGNNTNMNKLVKLQKRAARVITGSNYEIRSSDIFKKLNWEPLETTLKKRELVMTFKAIRSFAPEYLSNLFTATFNNDYSLRSNNRNLCLKKPKTNFMKNSFSYRGSSSWNKLPMQIRDNYNRLSIDSFKSTINGYFKS